MLSCDTSPNLVFLPGASGSTEFWQPVQQFLSDKYSSNIISYPEFGGWPSYPGVNSFESLQEYVLDQLEASNIVIAQSMGGIFAVQAVLQKPEKVKALVLVATSGGIDLSQFNVQDWRDEYKNTFQVPDWFVDYQNFLDERLCEIECPVLLIWGDNDPISPIPVGEYLHEKLVHSELAIIQEGQHDLALKHAKNVSQLIRSFIEKLET
ncbi:alpha/beta fold hydrolase [Acinetobacter stercoris]|uniref:Pimeloyl-[acyl-carrier protein] methyl ester esterase n=1 Tax=Acinetobacter stercoris TaxID=2126983 RepID=A0A2U3MVK0_9GAMM|nr:alpha/beta hydrolase [Acinetobacter stercoris]SPL69452.1 Pimeloyl-[acyl-carrier protein] methyl ester esterase [Acinetobacter stercoris]